MKSAPDKEIITTGQITPEPEDDPNKTAETYLRELGQQYVNGKIDLDVRAKLAGVFLEKQPPNVQNWLSEATDNFPRRRTRLLMYVTQGVAPKILQSEERRARKKPKSPSHGIENT